LDAQAEWGNNAQWGKRMGFEVTARFGDQDVGYLGHTGERQFANAQALADHVAQLLGRSVVCIDPTGKAIQRVAWCSGGAQGYFEAAIAAGVDAFLTGEISEPQMHYAHEMGVAFLACGHHASERYGAPALAAHVAERYGLKHHFIDLDNPA
jgi:putative NIF3 family GTP cyclohydrolase 1 type 2